MPVTCDPSYSTEMQYRITGAPSFIIDEVGPRAAESDIFSSAIRSLIGSFESGHCVELASRFRKKRTAHICFCVSGRLIRQSCPRSTQAGPASKDHNVNVPSFFSAASD